MKTQPVREQLLEHTLVLIRRRGFNGFSYRDLAELVGVKTSSIHYYFPSKDDLVLEAVKTYSARITERMRNIDPELPLLDQARQYLEPIRATCGSDQICLAGMLSTEVLSLPECVHKVLKDFYAVNEAWLTKLLEKGQEQRDMPYPVPPAMLAQVVYGALQSGLIAARLFGNQERVEAAAHTLLGALENVKCPNQLAAEAAAAAAVV
ncbi:MULTISPECIES: TetR/AcrR family transcriptional regulator [Cupriavidus]|uniref:TetR/AcrR family transcriptional regulator n=1 Tax=Cupriavidus pauculus TaxID=82633 RepID=A0A5P2HCQ6_9BURK|nr:TetR/AcrR family transcriptional regulator [Cupriavidus pauculus]QET06047.1 TetR/AcrR family transcriptional regulator [Cupriavidus pauculus]